MKHRQISKRKVLAILVILAVLSVFIGTSMAAYIYYDSDPLLPTSMVDSITGEKWNYNSFCKYTPSDLKNGELPVQNGSSTCTNSVLSPPGFRVFYSESFSMGKSSDSGTIIIYAIFLENDSCSYNFFNQTMNDGFIGPPFHQPLSSINLTWSYENAKVTESNGTIYLSSVTIGYKSNIFIAVAGLNISLSRTVSLKLLIDQAELIS